MKKIVILIGPFVEKQRITHFAFDKFPAQKLMLITKTH